MGDAACLHHFTMRRMLHLKYYERALRTRVLGHGGMADVLR